MVRHQALQNALMASVQSELVAIYQALQTAAVADGKTMDDLLAFTASGMYDENDPTNNTFWSVEFDTRNINLRKNGEPVKFEKCLELTFSYPPAAAHFSMIYLAESNRFELVSSAVYPAWIWSQTVKMSGRFAAMTPTDVITAGGFMVYK